MTFGKLFTKAAKGVKMLLSVFSNAPGNEILYVDSSKINF